MVYLTDDVPEFPFDPSLCQSGRAWVEPKCDISRPSFDARQQFYVLLDGLAMQNANLRPIVLYREFCDESRCSMQHKGLLLYRDFNHLNLNGSDFVGAAITRTWPELARVSGENGLSN